MDQAMRFDRTRCQFQRSYCSALRGVHCQMKLFSQLGSSVGCSADHGKLDFTLVSLRMVSA